MKIMQELLNDLIFLFILTKWKKVIIDLTFEFKYHIIMIKVKQPFAKLKNPIPRKPSLPIKRASSAHSNISDQSSCLSDRVAYKKSLPQDLSSGPFDTPFTKQYSSTNL